MIKCLKCNKRMFVDRIYTTTLHIEVYCLACGSRRFFHPPEDSIEGTWLLKKEVLRAKATIAPL